MSAAADIPPSRSASVHEVLHEALAALEQGRRVVLATVLRRQGSTPATPGQKLALLDETTAVGTVGGGALEAMILREMVALSRSASVEPVVRTVALGPELGMSCGGAAEILLEPLDPGLAVLVVGAGHVGAALAPLLVSVGLRVVVCDDRPSIVAASALVASARLTLLGASHDDPRVLQALGASPSRSAALVMTHDPDLAAKALEWAVPSGFGFVGGVGSRNKAARLHGLLAGRGLDVSALRMPLGVDIGARLPAEIALSIAAEMVRWRRSMAGAGTPTAPTDRT
jgi:xanthine dehydrogenase accessory factor